MATITRRGKGWFVQIRKKGFTPRYQTFPTKAEAQIWAREQESKIDLRTAPTGSAQLFDQALDVLSQKYGVAKISTNEGTNKTGGPRTTRVAIWHFREGSLTLFSYSDEDDAMLSYCCSNLPERSPATPDF